MGVPCYSSSLDKPQITDVYTYDQQFYKYINRGALDSAKEVVPVLLELLPGTGAVLDVHARRQESPDR